MLLNLHDHAQRVTNFIAGRSTSKRDVPFNDTAVKKDIYIYLPGVVILRSQVHGAHSICSDRGIRKTPGIKEHSHAPITPALAGFPEKLRPLHGLQYGFPDDGEVVSELARVVAANGSVGEGQD